MKRRTPLRLFLLIMLFVFLTGILNTTQADIEVHFLDVGQGDAILIVCDGEAMLIDGGGPSSGQFIYAYLREHVAELIYMISTHPHADHVGGLAAALNAVPVGVIFSPVDAWDTKVFENFVNYAEMQGTPIVCPNEGDGFKLGGADVMVLHCWPEAWETNDMSIMLRVDYGDTSFLFTGDAEYMSEYIMLDSGWELKADVLKVGHHGSDTSSTQEFIDAVQPDYAVISCGKNNPYGHPAEEVLERLKECTVLRTDELGTVIMLSDGENIGVDISSGRK